MPALPDTAATRARWSDLRKRVLSAVLLAPLVLICIVLGGWPFNLLLIAAGLGMVWEWLGICGLGRFNQWGAAVFVAVGAAAIAAALTQAGWGLVILCSALLAALAWPNRAGAWGIPYVGVGTVAMLWLRADPAVGLTNLLFLLLLVWSSDIGAYMTGRLLGGPKLAPSISPGKTWSGAAGGLIGAIGAGLAVAAATGSLIQPGRIALIAAGLGITAQMGDLLESLLKRRFGVKDSGMLIPGHGGLLDRLDALLIAAPIAALLALMAGRGVVLWQ